MPAFSGYGDSLTTTPLPQGYGDRVRVEEKVAPVEEVAPVAPYVSQFPAIAYASSSSVSSGPWYEWLGIQKRQTVTEQAAQTQKQCVKEERKTERSIKRSEDEEKRMAKQAQRAMETGDQAKLKQTIRKMAMNRKKKGRYEQVAETNSRMGSAIEDFKSQAEIGQNMQNMSRVMGIMANSQSLQGTAEMKRQFKQNEELFKTNSELLDGLWDDDRKEEAEFGDEFTDQIMLDYNLKLTNVPMGGLSSATRKRHSSPTERRVLVADGGIPNVQQTHAATSISRLEPNQFDSSEKDLIDRFNALLK